MSDAPLSQTGLGSGRTTATNAFPITVLFAAIALAMLAAGCKKHAHATGGASNSDPPTPAGSGPGPFPALGAATSGNPDLLVDVKGPFPVTKPFAGGYNPKPHEVLTVYLVAVGITIKNNPPDLVHEILDHYAKKLDALAGGKRNRTAFRVDAPDGKSILQTIHLAPVTEDAAEFARKIDFGTVRGVRGREIILVVRAESVPLPDKLKRSLPPKTAPNPRTIDPAKMIHALDVRFEYERNAKQAEAKYAGQQQLLQAFWPDLFRAADGTPCVVIGADKGQSRPFLVVLLANESGWKEGARLPKEEVFVEGKFVGLRPVESLPWMRNWAKLPQHGGIQGYVILIEGGKIVTPPPK